MNFITKKSIKLPKRNPKSHKGDNGQVLVIGGSKDYVGCLALAGLAALRSGVDWVTVAAPEKTGWAVNALTADLVVKKYKGDDFCASRAKDILKLEKGFDAVLIGNGIGMQDRKSTRLNSSHSQISYAVFCLKKIYTFEVTYQKILGDLVVKERQVANA